MAGHIWVRWAQPAKPRPLPPEPHCFPQTEGGRRGWRPALECVPGISLISPGAVSGQRDQHVERREGLGRIVSPAGLLLCTEVEVSYQGLGSSDPFLSMPAVRSGPRGNLWRTLRVNTVLVSGFFFLFAQLERNRKKLLFLFLCQE